MEKSIEEIWKAGFLRSDTLIVPKINDLYNQKSIHIIDKIKRMLKINLIAIVVFSFFSLIASFFVGIPLMGGILFITLNALVVINVKLLYELERINKGENSYQYLKEFNSWIQKQLSINKRIATLLYPVILTSVILGFCFKEEKGVLLGEKLINKVLIHFPDLYLIYGIPLVVIVLLFVLLGLVAFLGGRIYLWDVNIVYGRVFKKLSELMTDLESLKG